MSSRIRTHAGSTSLVALALTLSTSFLGGCGGGGDDLPRQAISGTVTSKGAPLGSGSITFQPMNTDGKAQAGAAGITDGNYSISQADGLVPGTYKVLITSVNTSLTPVSGGMPGDPTPPPKESIPAKYNSKSTLTAEVKEGGPNKFDFTLEAK